jgi:hypothetical protein
MGELARYDWDFRAVDASEVVACCHYEFARESDTFVKYYDEQIRQLTVPK